MTALARFRSWVGSVEFAVLATCVVVALVAGGVAFQVAPDRTDGFFVVFLAGIAVPNVYEDAWPGGLDTRLAGVAWALGACAVLLACFVAISVGLRTVADDTTAAVAGFIGAWLVGLFGARAVA